MKIEAIYVDMDGVLCDFVSAAFEVHGKDPVEMMKIYPPGEYGALYTLCAQDEESFWAAINKHKGDWYRFFDVGGSHMWEHMVKAYPWADLLWNLCEERADTWVLSAPARDAGSSYGKVKWLQAWKGEKFRRYVLAPKKYHLGRPGALLIDDDPENVRKWNERGGSGILFPRLWNDRYR